MEPSGYSYCFWPFVPKCVTLSGEVYTVNIRFSLTQASIPCQILGRGKFEFNFYNCKEKKKVLCEVPTDMEKMSKKRNSG